MKIFNRHERRIPAPPDEVGSLLDSLSGPADRLWPADDWPAMKFDAPLREGARGGHGPVRYRVTEYMPGRRIVFQFEGGGLTDGLDGRHFFEVIPRQNCTLIRHVVDADCGLRMWAKWHILIGPMHDALIEDAFDRVEQRIHGALVKRSRWSPWVRFLRKMRKRKATGRTIDH
jgi:carbon monoxide dehydrogenase subunit G